ncbi:MAG: DUF4956 domain-containing protein [Catonella sp.]|uniref:DUF4956 domain-containing protein n=1 Tax=Catonella sp. TaxID=2382125 RepID=UPI003FA062B1
MDIFSSIFSSGTTTTAVSPITVLICIGAALAIGIFLALVYTYRSRYTQSFVITLAMLPAVVSMVILLVNGNAGAGVAVAGTFGLVRFRSVPGTAKEIGAIFLAMTTGLAAGMGYIGYAAAFALIMGIVTLVYNKFGLGLLGGSNLQKSLSITIPENLDYTDVFTETLGKYTKDARLLSVTTTNMGSLFKLNYDVTLKKEGIEKEFIDELRCKNGNLEIRLNRPGMGGEEL